MKKFIIPALAVYLLACEKRTTFIQEPSLLITQAKAYFTDSVLGRTIPLTYRAAQAKTFIWNDAQISTIGGRPAVVVTITHNQPMMVKANFAGDFYFHLNYLTQLVIKSFLYFVL
jgi:hypothetical protein